MDNKKRLVGVALAAIMVISLFAAFTVPVYAAEGDITTLGEIQKAIEESGAEWQAGNTSVSGLSFEEKQQLCGLKIRRYTKDLGREGEQKVMGVVKDSNAMTAEGISQEKIPLRASMPPFASPGEVLALWTATNTYVWGVGFDGSDVWISDPVEIKDYEYTTTGAYLSSFNTPWAAWPAWPADFTWNSTNNTLWQVNVGGDNCIYELDPANGNVLSVICDPDGIWNWTSQRGLAYDAGTDTFYVGGWNDGIVYHIQGPTWANPGKIIDQFTPPDPARAISGLAFAPDGTLWIATNWCPDMLYQVDLTTHNILQCFAHPEYLTDWFCGVAGGIACDAAGNLWMVSQATKNVYYVDTTGAPTYPDAFDWRDNSGDWTTPIRDQGPCGSCWAFGSIAAMESHIDIQNNNPAINQDLSEQYPLSCSDGDCTGWYYPLIMDYLMDTGTVDEACFPYQANDTISCDAACDDADCRTWQITDWDWVPPSTSEIQGHLLDAPIVTGMAVYNDFFGYTGGIYEHVLGDLAGYHLVSMVGYNDTEHYWICKNSWNTSWGENGWFRIRYGECEIDTMNAYIVPPITESIMKVNKTVFDETTGEWVDMTYADVGDTVRFRIFIPNPCNNLTDVEVNDILSDGLEYADDATVNGVACEPEEIISNPDGTTTIKWKYNVSEPCTEPFQELEVPESTTIEFDAHVIKACLYANCANATAYCGECMPPEQIFVREDCAEVMSALLYEDFEGTFPPSGWTVIDNTGTINLTEWVRNDTTGRPNYADTGFCAIADSDYYLNDPMDTDLISPVIDCTDLSDVYLTYDTAYENFAGYDWANVSARSSATGGDWVTILAWNEDHSGPLNVNLDISAYADNQPDLQVRFNYDTKSEEWLWYWEVDNVVVCGAPEELEFELEFDTGNGTYPSIMGTHNGTITPNVTIYSVSRLYTYPCTGTGGHSESVAFFNSTTEEEIANGTWNG
ncbi:MAG: hypothetical protein KAT65_12800, partial [Methanophagales archaeon]|nr:hypothetical protein [Methanophagales archaeon]